MAASIVYDNVVEGAQLEAGQLFTGKTFWVAQRVPHRVALLNLVRANGGQIVSREKEAVWMVADHFRKDCPPGSISYEFIHKSIAKGEVLDPDDFPAGPKLGTARDPGSIVRPPKGTRVAYTPEDDRILYKWVKDSEASGAQVSGNELYKQLEHKNPRHTWQSWRDRWLKQLQNRPPSAFNLPDNALPSPPSDQSSREPAVEKTGLAKNKDRALEAATDEREQEEEAASKLASVSHENYTVDQLAATFTTNDWEELYAFVENIDSTSHNKLAYEAAWAKWAESRDNQTAKQWQQYYEQIVRPQWRLDPVSMRERIRKTVMERYKDSSSSPAKSQEWSQAQDKTVTASQDETRAAVKETDGAADELSTYPSESRLPEVPTFDVQPITSTTMPSDSRLLSSSTAQNETPQYIRDGYERALKRIRGALDDSRTPEESVRPTKVRRTSLSPARVEPEQPVELVDTQEQPLELSSASSQPTDDDQNLLEAAAPEQLQEQVVPLEGEQTPDDSMSESGSPRIAPLPRPPIIMEEGDDGEPESLASSDDFTHIEPLPRPTQVVEDDDDELPSSTPTPRATKVAAFDTQAILSSPSQPPLNLSKLPRPPLDSSPPHHPESDASTTQSLQDFRLLNEQETQHTTQTQPQFTRLPRLASPTPSIASEASSAGSGDPDEPLAADEIDDFFEEQHAQGFDDEFISRALKCTRFRPGLAVTVLDAWKEGKSLPDARGVWSRADDEAVQGGDGATLARLQKKHTMDGWGGITERMNWLRAWERR